MGAVCHTAVWKQRGTNLGWLLFSFSVWGPCVARSQLNLSSDPHRHTQGWVSLVTLNPSWQWQSLSIMDLLSSSVTPAKLTASSMTLFPNKVTPWDTLWETWFNPWQSLLWEGLPSLWGDLGHSSFLPCERKLRTVILKQTFYVGLRAMSFTVVGYHFLNDMSPIFHSSF